MMKHAVSLVIACCTAIFSAACAPQPSAPPDTRADEAALRSADIAWSKAGGAKDVNAFVSYYTADAVVMPPNEAMATGPENIRKTIEGLLQLPGLVLTWQPVKVEVARSGDIGYSQGTYEMTMNDPSGKPVMDHGKYLEVWKKQPDGSWKCAVDTFNSDVPAAPPPK